MNKRGFTLVELLAVIIILGILVAIIIPKVSDVIDEQKVKTLKITLQSAQKAYDEYTVDNDNMPGTYIDSSEIPDLNIDKGDFDTIYISEYGIIGQKGDECIGTEYFRGSWQDIESIDCEMMNESHDE